MNNGTSKILFLSTYLPGEGPPSRYTPLFSEIESKFDYQFEVRTRFNPSRYVSTSFDVVMGSDPTTFARAWLLGRRHGKPVLFDFRDPYLIFYDRQVFANVLLSAFRNKSRAIFTSMKYYIDEYDLQRDKCVYAPNAAPLEWTDLKGSPNQHQFCYAGQVTKSYNLDVAIEAVAELVDDFPRISLKIAGDGPLRGQLRDLADKRGVTENVEFLGIIAHEELPELVLSSEAGLALNPWVGKKEFEYLACGRPCLSNEKRAQEEDVEGIHTVPATIEGVTTGMRYILENEVARESLGAAGRERVREFYNWEHQAEIWHRTLSKYQ